MKTLNFDMKGTTLVVPTILLCHSQIFVYSLKDGKCDGGHLWTLTYCCRAVDKYDIRTSGLFKNEFEGDGAIALISKTYCCWGTVGDKYSSEGLSKASNSSTCADFKRTLFDTLPISGVNRGRVLKDNNMYTYSQICTLCTTKSCTGVPKDRLWCV